MSSITKDNFPQGSMTTFRNWFWDGFYDAGLDPGLLGFIAKMEERDETIIFPGMLGGLKASNGNRKVDTANLYTIAIAYESFDEQIQMDPWDEQSSQEKAANQELIKQLGRDAAIFAWDRFIALLNSGDSEACYDAQYFFDTDHASRDSGTQSNKSTTALTGPELGSALSKMRRFKDDRGRPLRVRPSHLLVGPELEDTAKTILSSDRIVLAGDGGGTAVQKEDGNPRKGALKLLVDPQVDTNNWYVLALEHGNHRPLQGRWKREPKFDALDENSDTYFNTGKLTYGVTAKWAEAFGLWQLAFGGIVT